MEIEHEELRRDGFFFQVETFRLDLYRLLSFFYASAGFARLRGRMESSSVADLADEFEESEITLLLVTIAARVRVVQDRDKGMFRRIKAHCGQLVPDCGCPRKTEPLTLREACNKIIHAKRFNFDVRTLKVKDEGYVGTQIALRPYVHLYGENNGTPWKATLDIEEFVRRNGNLIRG